MVALTCPQAFQALFQTLPKWQGSQIFSVPFQVSPQFPDVLFLFGIAVFSFQHVQAAVDTLQVVLPDLVMETVNQAPLPDPSWSLTDFLVHMVLIPEMLVALAACHQFIEHIPLYTRCPRHCCSRRYIETGRNSCPDRYPAAPRHASD
jgi:hypothetical protein